MENLKRKDSNELESKLRSWFSGFHTVVIAGIGNPLRKDDFVGVEIVRILKDMVPLSVHIIECETVPESFIQSIVDLAPSHVLLIDAAIINSKPGESKLVDSKELQMGQLVSTHALPLRIFCQYLSETTEAQIALILVQPEDASFGEGLTEGLKLAARDLANVLSRVLND